MAKTENKHSKPRRLPPMSETRNRLMEVIISPSVSDIEGKLELVRSQPKAKQLKTRASTRSLLKMSRSKTSHRKTITDDRSTSPGMSSIKDELENSKSKEDLLGTRLKALKLRREKIVSDFLTRERKNEDLQDNIDLIKLVPQSAPKGMHTKRSSVQMISRAPSEVKVSDTAPKLEESSTTLPLVDISISVIGEQFRKDSTGKTTHGSGSIMSSTGSKIWTKQFRKDSAGKTKLGSGSKMLSTASKVWSKLDTSLSKKQFKQKSIETEQDTGSDNARPTKRKRHSEKVMTDNESNQITKGGAGSSMLSTASKVWTKLDTVMSKRQIKNASKETEQDRLSGSDNARPTKGKKKAEKDMTDIESKLKKRSKNKTSTTEIELKEKKKKGKRALAVSVGDTLKTSVRSSITSVTWSTQTGVTESDSFTSKRSAPDSTKTKLRTKSGVEVTLADMTKGADKLRKLFQRNRDERTGALDEVAMAKEMLKLLWSRDIVNKRLYSDDETSDISTLLENKDLESKKVALSIQDKLKRWGNSIVTSYNNKKDSAEAVIKTKHIASKGSVYTDTTNEDITEGLEYMKAREHSLELYLDKKVKSFQNDNLQIEFAGYKKSSYKGSIETEKGLLKDGKDYIQKIDSRKEAPTYIAERLRGHIYAPKLEGMRVETHIEKPSSSDLGIETPSRDSLKSGTSQPRSASRDRKSSDLTKESSDSSFSSSEDEEGSISTEVSDYKREVVSIAAEKKKYLDDPRANLHIINPRKSRVSKQLALVDTLKTDLAGVKAFKYSTINELPAPSWIGDKIRIAKDREEPTISSVVDDEDGDPKILAQKYIESNGIYELFHLLTTKLIIETPDKPLDFLIQTVRNILTKKECLK